MSNFLRLNIFLLHLPDLVQVIHLLLQIKYQSCLKKWCVIIYINIRFKKGATEDNIFLPNQQKIEKKEGALLATITATRWTGNRSFFQAGLMLIFQLRTVTNIKLIVELCSARHITISFAEQGNCSYSFNKS